MNKANFVCNILYYTVLLITTLTYELIE